MQSAVPLPGAVSTRSVLTRLAIACLLGLPLGPIPIAPDWVQWILPLVVLVIALLISVQYDFNVRHGIVSAQHAIRASQFALLLTILLFCVTVLLVFAGSGFIGLALIPFSISLLVTFAIGGSGTWQLALGCGLSSWLGASLHLLFAMYLLNPLPSTSYGQVLLMLTAIEIILGMVIALPGAYLGRMLRQRLLRDTTTTIKP